ncbi:hypothetical protein BBP40_001981 [Aspergillus hancockii]|nr:hypothetical protein BBP40_001981 [Aspergillus hancockii]
MTTEITLENLSSVLADDIKVKVAGIDCDGILRGKVMSKDKFLGIAQKGFGFSSAVFGWDMQDVLYTTDANVAPKGSGYVDFIAVPDLSTFRRIPWEEDIPFFLVRFIQNGETVSADGRNMLKSLCDKLAAENCQGMAGVELEFMNFQTPSEDGYGPTNSQTQNIAAFLEKNAPGALRPITAGSFSYSATRPPNISLISQALKVCDIREMADRVSLFKLLAKSIGVEHGITPCFMAKPIQGQPGSSGHIHVSLTDLAGKNLFGRETPDTHAPWPDAVGLSDLGRQFLAGLLEALPDIMPLFAPTINSYKRLVENFWAPVNISWGLEDRMASIRIITPPVCKPGATRFEVRIPGADLHPHYALSVILAAGWRGVQKKLEIKVPPVSAMKQSNTNPDLLPNTLEEALKRFNAPNSIAREILGGEFVDFFTATREHELRVWREAVTDWEFKRIAHVTALFSYPNCATHCPIPPPTLNETIKHWLADSIRRDGYTNATIAIHQEQGNITATITGVPPDYPQFITSFLAQGTSGLTDTDRLKKDNKWKPDWFYFLPLGMALRNHPTVQLLHFPPDTVMTQTQDYLKAATTRRWASLLVMNGVTDRETDRYQRIMDIAPIAAPASAGAELEGVYDYYDDYSSGLVREWTKPVVGSYAPRPMVAFGGPARQWLRKYYKLSKVDVLTLTHISPVGGQTVPVLGANHPSKIWYAANVTLNHGNETKADLVGLRTMTEDLTCACWQASMGKNASSDAAVALQTCKAQWQQTKKKQACESFYISIRHLSEQEAEKKCNV